ncbi:MAG: HAMP domain-containing histidine kinase [Anaerolineae bacterium]|jgi:signal transduction histidine kinase|nr:HAMP domain-containing histidine kinase [Anaerolineae bacterium]
MFASLRTRLLISYILLLIITLSVIVVALLLTTGARPAPVNETYRELSNIARGSNLSNLLNNVRLNNPNAGNFQEVLGEFATSRNVRVIAINMTVQSVLYDSNNHFVVGTPIRMQVDTQNATRFIPVLVGDPIYGSFPQDGIEWLFFGITRLVGGQQVAFILADTRPTQSLQDTLGQFGNDLLLPLVQAALIGSAIALISSALISQTIAQPLQALSVAASDIAQGGVHTPVAISGPTEVKTLATAFNDMTTQVSQAQQSQRDFLANVSHDLKTPLTSIQGYAQAIIDGAAKDPKRAATIIYEESERLNRMVTQLTDLARIEAGRFSFHFAPIDLGQMVTSVAHSLAVMAEKKQIVLDVDAPPMPPVAADGDRFVQVLNNLISNAIKYTPDGGHVWVKARALDGGVEVSIADNGVGIPEKDLPRIFERFYQVDKARGPSRGTGLGLAIVKEIIQAHGGRIDVQSVEGRGSRFSVWMPSPSAPTVLRHRLLP